MSRETTNKLLEMVDEGLLDARTLALACLKYMSEDEVEDMAHANEFLEEEEEDEDHVPSSPYIINIGDALDNLYPTVAYINEVSAIAAAAKKAETCKYVEVVYMPEDDPDTNEVVWRSWEN
jgi:hypothetical protein